MDFTKTELADIPDADQIAAAATETTTLLAHIAGLEPSKLKETSRFIGRFMPRVERNLRETGYLLFEQLLLQTRELLKRRPDVRRRVQSGIRQLLVDEFQDTDATQCDIVRLLALAGPLEERPGLFLVGDPKQSIYGWRNADLEAYEGLVAETLELGGERHALVRNFRSSAPILDEVDRVFAVNLEPEVGVQPPHQRLEAARTSAGALQLEHAVEYWASWVADPKQQGVSMRKPSSDKVRALEARAVAADILSQHQRHGHGWSEFAVLFRSGTHYEDFLDRFREFGIPFAVARDKQFYRRREIIEATALIRTLFNPLDHLALLSYMRSASVGVPDAALIPLWRGRFPQLMSELSGRQPSRVATIIRLLEQTEEEIADSVDGLDRIAGWAASAGDAIQAIAELRELSRQAPAVELIERLRQRTLLEATEAARHLGAFRVANLERFFHSLETTLSDPGRSVQSVLRDIERHVVQATEGEEAMPKEAAEDAVQILTIHGSKGLEFRHVYLVQLHGQGRSGTTKPLEFRRPDTDEAPLEYRLLGLTTLRFDKVERRARQIEQAERVRLLYVAMTRAVERLVLVGNWQPEPTGVPPRQAASFLDLLANRPGIPANLAELEQRAQAAGESHVESDGMLWRFPWLQPEKAANSAASSATESSPVSPAVTHAVDGRHTRRAAWLAAHRRAARPLGGAPSRYAESTEMEEVPVPPRPSAEETGRIRLERDQARAVGTVVHRALESLSLNQPLAQSVTTQIERIDDYLLDTERAGDEKVGDEVRRLLARFFTSRLGQRLEDLAPRVIGREVPILLPAPPASTAIEPYEAAGEPLCFLSGSIDIVYLDPDSARPVVADFKTDPVHDEQQLAELAERYRPQLSAYADAVQGTFGLSHAPRMELWLLRADRVVTVSRTPRPEGRTGRDQSR